MARFKIYSSSGVLKYEGAPTFTETYLKAGYLEFREISSPTPIEWALGDHVVYPRTGLTYSMYSIPVPTVKKQARSGSYGAAFVYQSVQFFAPTKMLEMAPFRDLVRGDNRIHFSTQNSISVWDDVYGIAERIEVSMNETYPDKWTVEVVDTTDETLLETLKTELNYTVEGVTCMGALDKVYELWDNIGWTYSYIGGKHVITIGGADVRTASNTAPELTYGKGNGLVTLERSITNRDSMATRLFVYGSSANMVSRYYNNLDLDIKEKESIDIQHLMLPVEPVTSMDWPGWGKTDGQYDAAETYIQDDDAIAEYGLLVKSVYFDGSDNEDIHPSLKGVTIGELRNILGEGTQYYPSETIYTDPTERVDLIRAAANPQDSGSTSATGEKYVETERETVSASQTAVDLSKPITVVRIAELAGFENEEGTLDIRSTVTGGLFSSVSLGSAISADATVTNGRGLTVTTPVTLTRTQTSAGYVYKFDIPEMQFSEDFAPYGLTVSLMITASGLSGTGTLTLNYGYVEAGLETARPETFTLTLKQIGFDINERAALGEGKVTLNMTSGLCNGRSFLAKSCTYQPDTDTWELVMWRQNDTSTDMWYPNSSYRIEEGDSFTLTDIAMPDTYIKAAAQKLLTAGRKLLAELSTPQPAFTPKVDAKYIREYQESLGTEHSPLLSGMYLHINDSDIQSFGDDYVLIDTVTINEGESNIPTYSITLRERKKVTIKETGTSSSSDMSSSVSDGTTTDSGSSSSSTGSLKLRTYDIQSGVLSYTSESVFTTPNLVTALYDSDNNAVLTDTRIVSTGSAYGVKVTFGRETTEPFRLVVIGR